MLGSASAGGALWNEKGSGNALRNIGFSAARIAVEVGRERASGFPVARLEAVSWTLHSATRSCTTQHLSSQGSSGRKEERLVQCSRCGYGRASFEGRRLDDAPAGAELKGPYVQMKRVGVLQLYRCAVLQLRAVEHQATRGLYVQSDLSASARGLANESSMPGKFEAPNILLD